MIVLATKFKVEICRDGMTDKTKIYESDSRTGRAVNRTDTFHQDFQDAPKNISFSGRCMESYNIRGVPKSPNRFCVDLTLFL